MPCRWGVNNSRSGIALAVRHRLKRFIHVQAHGLDREMSTPPMLSCGVRPIYLPYSQLCSASCNSGETVGCFLPSVLLPLLLHPFNSLFSRTTWISRYQKGKTSLDLNEARDKALIQHINDTNNEF